MGKITDTRAANAVATSAAASATKTLQSQINLMQTSQPARRRVFWPL